MKKTEYKCVAKVVNGYPKYKRVYEEEGKLFIKEKGGYVNIDNLPCRNYMQKDY